MIKRKYAYMRIDDYKIDFEDVENTITYSLSAKNLENNLNKREEELCNKIADLEAKLAEKERQLKLAEELLIKQEKEYDEQLEKQAKIHYKHLKEKDQDKISFALEQLEKVQLYLKDKNENEVWHNTLIDEERDDIAEFIDQQIALLKGE